MTDGDRIDVDDMVEFYSAFFQDVFSLEIDDGSLLQMARTVCDLWRELHCAGTAPSSSTTTNTSNSSNMHQSFQHASPTLDLIYQRWTDKTRTAVSAQVVDKRQYISENDINQDSDDDDHHVQRESLLTNKMEVEYEKIVVDNYDCNSNIKLQIPPPPPKTEIDEDGLEWTVVRKQGRR